MSAEANFAAVLPRVAVGIISTANAARDGTGVGPATPIFIAGAGGSKIEQITVKARGTTTAGMVRLYLYDGSGTDGHLFYEVPVTAALVGATVEAFSSHITFDNLVIPNGWSVTASTHNAETFGILVFGADF